ncbi:MAG: di-trans,poly-cis-decaprenylcistransferase [Gemmatimonadales bacterium]|nr:MAG: di-trans,poly-cis-decaprenylcistransferase [Gemmatimonadales bacterium]
MTNSAPSPSHGSDRVPRHVAVIMDGNGRWAADRELPRYEGHREGMKAVRETIEAAIAEGVEILTLFAFSTENWNRPEEEILALMSLLQIYAHSERDELVEQGVQVKVLGDLAPMDRDTLEAVRAVEEATRGGRQLRLNLMVSYSGRTELLNAVRSLAREAALGALDPDDILPRHLEQYLHTRDLPDPDLLIRTSGEFRISNFMLWQLAYTEIHISPVLWPDFTRGHFGEAIRDYQRRERRFGRVTAP